MIVDDDVRRFHAAVDPAASLVLVSHLNPDGDAIGSLYSLAAFLGQRGKRVRIVNQDSTPEALRFLERDGLIVERYDSPRHDAALRAAERIVLVDNSAPDRLGSMEPLLREVAARTLCIDHHPMRDAPWSENIVDVQSSATTAMIYDLTSACGWRPDVAAAQAIYVGLATDTGFFRFNSTSARAHEIAAEMLNLGVDSAGIYRALYERNPVAYVRLLGHALAGLRLDAGGSVASVKITRQMIESLQAEDVDATEITTSLLAIDGVRIAILFRELPAGRIKVSLRSKGSLDVHRLAIEFGGGGHRNASGIVMSVGICDAVRVVIDRASALVTTVADDF